LFWRIHREVFLSLHNTLGVLLLKQKDLNSEVLFFSWKVTDKPQILEILWMFICRDQFYFLINPRRYQDLVI